MGSKCNLVDGTPKHRRSDAAEPVTRISYITTNASWTALTPGAIHAASSARSRAYQDPTAPASVTNPSTTLTRINRASTPALRVNARSMCDLRFVVCGRGWSLILFVTPATPARFLTTDSAAALWKCH